MTLGGSQCILWAAVSRCSGRQGVAFLSENFDANRTVIWVWLFYIKTSFVWNDDDSELLFSPTLKKCTTDITLWFCLEGGNGVLLRPQTAVWAFGLKTFPASCLLQRQGGNQDCIAACFGPLAMGRTQKLQLQSLWVTKSSRTIIHSVPDDVMHRPKVCCIIT